MEFWNERYDGGNFFYGTEPNDFLIEHARDFPAGGRVLCIGDGEGRNSVFLAGLGYAVTAMDASSRGMEKLRALAEERKVQVDTHVADLNDYDLGDQAWDGIVSIWCHLPSPLRRKVHAGCVRALKPGGLFLIEAYTPAQLAFATGGPKDVDMLPTLSLLKDELQGLTLVLARELEREVQEGPGHSGQSAVVELIGRKPF